MEQLELIPDTRSLFEKLCDVAYLRKGFRAVQATLKLLMEPLIDPCFSPNSYGFRPGRNQRQAVEAAREIVRKGKEYVVDIDLSKFFDRVNHDRLIAKLKGFIDDTRILRIIGMTLRSGVMVEGVVEATEEGTTQGSPLSPLLSNVVLDEMDRELERRCLAERRYCGREPVVIHLLYFFLTLPFPPNIMVLKKAMAIAKEKAISLFPVDWNMPKLNGFQFVQVIRKMDKYKALP